MRMNDSLEKGVGGSMNLSDYVELKGIKKGIEQGRRDGIRNMIELCQDLGTTEDNAKSQIIMRFRIPEEEAVKYIKTFWKSEKEQKVKKGCEKTRLSFFTSLFYL